MGRSKPNPILAAQERMLEEKHRRRMMALDEICIMAAMLAVNAEYQVGPKRAGDFLAEFLNQKMIIAKNMLDDVGDSREHKNGNGDPQILKTKHDLAAEMKRILGADNWSKFKELFGLLQEYW